MGAKGNPPAMHPIKEAWNEEPTEIKDPQGQGENKEAKGKGKEVKGQGQGQSKGIGKKSRAEGQITRFAKELETQVSLREFLFYLFSL